MSKTGHTKSKILDILGKGNSTLSDISEQLDLHPATVSQHLQELKEIGAIREVYNQYVKKWKYYSLNPDFDYRSLALDGTGSGSGVPNILKDKKLFYPVITLALIAVIYLLLLGNNTNAGKGRLVQIAITDPPTVPEGTQALYINYYSVSVHVVGNGTSEWIQSNSTSPFNSSGTINLMSLVNYSEIVANVHLPRGSRIDAVQFKIPSAQIMINNTVYNLVLRNNEISSAVVGDQNASQDSEVIVDLSPIVVPMYINGLVVFVMLPQTGSVSLNENASISEQNTVGKISRLNNSQTTLISSVNAKLLLSNTSLSAADKSINLNVTLRNPSTRGVVLRDVLILGPENLTNSTGTYVPIFAVPITSGHTGIEFLVQDNGSLDFADQQYISASLERINYSYPYATSGYYLAPNESVVLKFKGKLQLLNDLNVNLIKDDNYKISILGDNLSHLSTNITAG